MKLKLFNPSGHYVLKTVCTIVSCSLCTPVLLGLPFLKHNGIVVDANANTTFDKFQNFDLLNVTLPKTPPPNRQKLEFNYEITNQFWKFIKLLWLKQKLHLWKSGSYHIQEITKFDVIGAVCECLEVLTTQEQLECMG